MDDAAPRKLASIVAVDVAGYSRRTEADEEAAVRAVAILREQVALSAGGHGGRVFNAAGDGFMLEFPTVSGALAAAEQIARFGDPPVRVGVHVGEVSVTETGDLLGHGVNVAARIQQMASAGAVLVSGDVKRAVRGPVGKRLRPQGSVKLNKMSETLPVFALAPAEGGKAKGRRLKLALPVVLGAAAAAVLAVALAAWLARGQWERSPSHAPRVAVMAFDTLGQAPELHDVAVGLQDQILSVMSANQVRAVSRTDTLALRGGDARGALKRLGVTLLLDGTIQQNGQSLTVRVHLEDPRQHVTLWTTAVDGRSNAAQDLQLQVATEVADVLLCANGLQRSPSAPRDTDTIALFFRACDLSENLWGDAQRPEQVLNALRQVTARAPDFAQGYARLAYIQAAKARYALQPLDPAIPKEAADAARKALQVDPKDGDAWLALSLLQPVTVYQEREKLLVSGLSGATTNVLLLRRRAELLAEVGRMRDAKDYAVRAAASAPLDSEAAAAQAALEAATTILTAQQDIADDRRRWPNGPAVWTYSIFIAMWASDWTGAEAALRWPNVQAGPKSIAFLRTCVGALRSREPAKIASAEREARAMAVTDQADLHWALQCVGQLGLTDAAFDLAQQYQPSIYAFDGPGIFFFPSTASMRRDRRFMPLMARLGLVDYWRATGKWPDFCAEPGLPYECKAEAAKAVAASGH